MRLDVFLKTARLVKRRSVAHELCESGRVIVNGRAAKPAKEVKPGDVIVLQFASRTVELEVSAVVDGRSGRNIPREELYRLISETQPTREEDRWTANRL